MSAVPTKELRASNWGFLVRRLTASDAHRAVTEKLEKAPADELKRLLRHHRDGGFSDAPEIQFRASMDRWLGDAGMLYLGWLSGYVTDPSEVKEREPLLRILGNAAVREYYETHYPVAIPWLLRLHLEGNLELPSTESDKAAGAFERFSVLYERFKSDPDLLQFLDFLDGFWYGDTSARVGIQAVVESFGVPDRVALAFGGKSDHVTPLDRGIIGLVRFLAHSKDLDQLLTLLEDLPLVRSGFWFFYGYWFREFQTDVAEASNQALDNAVAAVRDGAPAGSADRISVVTSELDDWKRIMDRLTGSRYSAAIPNAVAAMRGSAHRVSSHEFVFPNDQSTGDWLNRFGRYEQIPQSSSGRAYRRRDDRNTGQEMDPEEKLLRAIFEEKSASRESPAGTETSGRDAEGPEEEMSN